MQVNEADDAKEILYSEVSQGAACEAMRIT